MTFRSLALRSAFCLVAALPVATPAFANSISGSIFCGAGSGNTPTSAPTSGACATFTTTSLNFSLPGSGSDTLGAFLASDAGAVSGVSYASGYSSSSSLNNTLFDFTGTTYVTTGTTYSVTHDDGTVLKLNGVVVINSAAPTSAKTNTYVGGFTGNASFDFLYSENNGLPAVYKTNLADASAVPEPSSLALLGTGVLAAAGAVRRRILG